jgi:hypothetical protein
VNQSLPTRLYPVIQSIAALCEKCRIDHGVPKKMWSDVCAAAKVTDPSPVPPHAAGEEGHKEPLTTEEAERDVDLALKAYTIAVRQEMAVKITPTELSASRAKLTECIFRFGLARMVHGFNDGWAKHEASPAASQAAPEDFDYIEWNRRSFTERLRSPMPALRWLERERRQFTDRVAELERALSASQGMYEFASEQLSTLQSSAARSRPVEGDHA